MNMGFDANMSPREIIARRAAQELQNGEVVNLGIGIPTQTPNYLPAGVEVMFHTENGAFGFGATPNYAETDSDLTNAGGEPVTLQPGASVMDLATSGGAMRKGYIDVTILGGLEVDQTGNLANWAVERKGKWWPGMGGAMDLCYGAAKVIVTMNHCDKAGLSKIRRHCALPLTGSKCVDVIITEKAVFGVGDECLIMRQAAPGLSPSEIGEITDAEFTVARDFSEIALDLDLWPN